MFLKSVFAKIMNIPIAPQISPVGDCHDIGNGIWKDTSNGDVMCAHVFDIESNTLKLKYQPGANLYSTHVITTEFVEQHPDVILIQIGADVSDFYNIANLAVNKAWPNYWTEKEYNKWKSPYYPPYCADNIANSDLIRNDLMNLFQLQHTTSWYEQYAHIKYSYVIDFKTVLGLDNKNLVQEVVDIIPNGHITEDVCKFVDEYQQLNKRLYFS